MELSKLLLQNYLPYAKSTIVGRAIPSIDGFKPVQRRILYTMYDMGLLGEDKQKSKSQRINGQTMRLHPNGDSSIYEALVLMTSGYDGLNIPYIESKGSFGKKYSRDLKYSAPRYTEAKLANICNEFFGGIKEDAVEFVENYDSTSKEPTLLPVKFPNILVNSSSGVAVGTSSCIPSFSLKNVCLATQGVITGDIKTNIDLAKVLGAPEFTTGGFLHASIESLEKLCETGRGSFVITGNVEIYNDRLVITEIPYTTTAEDIMDEIDTKIKEKKILGISDVKDEIGLNGLRLVVEIKRGYKSRDVLNQLLRMTSLRKPISFRTRVIVGNRCKELGIMEVITTWIDFRKQSLDRMYKFRLNRELEQGHLLSTWEKIISDISGVVQMITNNTDSVAKDNLIKKYGLDETQAEYLMDMKIRSITTNKANASINKLKDVRELTNYYKKVLNDSSEKDKIIVSELSKIIEKYGKDNYTKLVGELTEEDNKNQTVKISDEIVTVVLTENGYLKRLTSLTDISKQFISKNGEKEVKRWSIKNNEHLLVFDRFGTVHKILVDSIDSSTRANLTDELYKLAEIEKAEDVIYADACGDYSGYFNLIYPNGKGIRVTYDKAIGNRKSYKSLYDEVKPRQFFLTKENKFFLLTKRNKASYCDITNLGIISNRKAFKVARLSRGDFFIRLQTYKDVPNVEFINLDKYSKDYTVSIGNDILYADNKQIENSRKFIEEEVKRLSGENSYKSNSDSCEAVDNIPNENK